MLADLTNVDIALIVAFAFFIVAGVLRINKDTRFDNIFWVFIALGLAAFALAFAISP